MFLTILTKMNPIYHLLYSPVESLKSTEKNQLIENLLDVLKEKMKVVEKLEKYKVMYDGERQQREEMGEVGRLHGEKMAKVEGQCVRLEMEVRDGEREMEMLSC